MPKRFKLKDLEQPGSSQESRVSDDFVPLTVAAPKMQPVADFTKVVNNVNLYLDKTEAKEKEESKVDAANWSNRNAEGAEQMLDRFHKDAKGLEGDEKAKAEMSTWRALREEGILPDESDVAWLRHIGDLEANRDMSNLGKALQERVKGMSAIADEDGDLIDLEDVDEVFSEMFTTMTDKPLYGQSETAQRIVAEGSEVLREEFRTGVFNGRGQARTRRGEIMLSDQMVGGVSVNSKPIFAGIDALGENGLKGEELTQTLKDFRTAKDSFKDRGNVAKIDEAVNDASVRHFQALLANEEFEKVERTIHRMYGIETRPGIMLEDDPIYKTDFAIMLRKAQDGNAEDLLDQTRALGAIGAASTEIFKGHANRFWSEGLRGEALDEAAESATLDDPDYIDLQVAGKMGETSPALLGRWSGEARKIRQSARGAESDEHLAQYEIYSAKLSSGQSSQALVVAAAEAQGLPPQYVDALRKDTRPKNWATFRASEHGDDWAASQVRNTTATNGSEGVVEALEDAGNEARKKYSTLINDGLNRNVPMHEIVETAAWKQIGFDQKDARDKANADVQGHLKDINAASRRKDYGATLAALDAAQGVVDPIILERKMKEADEVDRTFRDRLFTGAEGAAVLEDVKDAYTMSLIAANASVEETPALIAGRSDVVTELKDKVLQDQERIQKLPLHEQADAWRASKVAARQESLRLSLDEDNRAVFDNMPEETVKDITTMLKNKKTMGALSRGERYNSAFTTTDPLQVDSVDDTSIHWGRMSAGGTEPWRVASLVSQDIDRAFANKVSSSKPGSYVANEKAYLDQQSLQGRYTIDQALVGKVQAKMFAPTSHKPDEEYGKARIAAMTQKDWTYSTVEATRTLDRRGGFITEKYMRGIYTKNADWKPDPYTTLFFRGDTDVSGDQKLTEFFNTTTIDDRKSIYLRLGRVVEDMPSADREFKDQQATLLKRFSHHDN
jgi:hypothetical protein